MTQQRTIVLGDPSIGKGDGLTDRALRGTGTSVPRGVEAVLEYADLTMGVHDYMDAYLIRSIEGLDDPDVRDARENLPAAHGEVPGRPLYGGRTIVINGRIRAWNVFKLRDMQEALRSAFALREEELPLYFRTGNAANDHFIMCRKFSKILMGEEQRSHDGHTREFQITLRASNPRFFSYQVMPYTLTGADRMETIRNGGNADAQPSIRLVGDLGGTIAVANNTTGRTFELDAGTAISAGDWIHADSTLMTLRDQDDANVFDLLADDSEFLELAPGDNDIELDTGITGSGQVLIWHRSAWL